VNNKRVEIAVAWAEEVQALSPASNDLTASAEGVLKSSDLARNTSSDLGMKFETEPSNFIKLLDELAPDDDR